MSLGLFIVIVLIVLILVWVALDQITFKNYNHKIIIRVVLLLGTAIWIFERAGITNLF